MDEGIACYDTNARRSIRWHYSLSTVQLVGAGLVPIFALSPGAWSKYAAALLGAMAGIARGIEALHKYSDHYHAWRFTAESLKGEKYEFEAGIGPYASIADEAAALNLLATRAEDLTSQENQQWLALQEEADNSPSEG